MKDESSKGEKKDVRENVFEAEGSFFNKVRSDMFRRKVEGVLKEGVIKNLVSDLKLPREIVTHLVSQIDETKQATLRLVSKEIRLFLENTNLADELANLLSQLSFEVSTKVRFVRNDPPEHAKKRRVDKKTASPDACPAAPEPEETAAEAAGVGAPVAPIARERQGGPEES